MLTLELMLGEKIPLLNFDEFKTKRFGYVEKDGYIQCLGLYNKNMLALPNSFKKLQNIVLIDLDQNPYINIPIVKERTKVIKETNKNGTKIESGKRKEGNQHKSIIKLIYDSKLNNSTSLKDDNSKTTLKSPILKDSNKELSSDLNKSKQEISTLFNKYFNKPKIEKRLDNCPSCKSQNFKSISVFLELINKDPRKIIYNIKSVSIMCCDCSQTSELVDPNSNDLEKISQLNDTIKNNLVVNLKKYYFCVMCQTYYEDLKRCPKHNILLHIPPQVFICGINRQYSSDNIIKEENKEV